MKRPRLATDISQKEKHRLDRRIKALERRANRTARVVRIDSNGQEL